MTTQSKLRLGAVATEQPTGTSFFYAGSGEGAWESSPVSGLVRRSLGGGAATGGYLEAWDSKPAPGMSAGEWISRDADLYMLVVTAGTLRIEGEKGMKVTLQAGDVLCMSGRYRHRLEGTSALRLLEVESPAGAVVVSGPTEDSGGTLLVHLDAPEAYDVGVSPTASRRFLKYREIPLPEAVEGFIRAEVIRAHIGGHASGWHHHPMAQIVFAIQGCALVDVDGHGTKQLESGTAIYIPAGLPHNLRDISDDYGLFEVFVPGIGGTTQCDPPAGWDDGQR